MASPIVAFRPTRGVALLTQAQAAERLERSVNVRVGIAWGLLLFNTLTFVAHWILLFYALTIQFALTIIPPSTIISHC